MWTDPFLLLHYMIWTGVSVRHGHKVLDPMSLEKITCGHVAKSTVQMMTHFNHYTKYEHRMVNC